jgi:hypothetical protein
MAACEPARARVGWNRARRRAEHSAGPAAQPDIVRQTLSHLSLWYISYVTRS